MHIQQHIGLTHALLDVSEKGVVVGIISVKQCTSKVYRELMYIYINYNNCNN